MNNARAIKEINCIEALERIFDFIEQELDTTGCAGLLKHVEECRHCFSRLELERLLKSRLGHLKTRMHSDSLHHRIDALLENIPE